MVPFRVVARSPSAARHHARRSPADGRGHVHTDERPVPAGTLVVGADRHGGSSSMARRPTFADVPPSTRSTAGESSASRIPGRAKPVALGRVARHVIAAQGEQAHPAADARATTRRRARASASGAERPRGIRVWAKCRAMRAATVRCTDHRSWSAEQAVRSPCSGSSRYDQTGRWCSVRSPTSQQRVPAFRRAAARRRSDANSATDRLAGARSSARRRRRGWRERSSRDPDRLACSSARTTKRSRRPIRRQR